jgi:hypothetical protein
LNNPQGKGIGRAFINEVTDLAKEKKSKETY